MKTIKHTRITKILTFKNGHDGADGYRGKDATQFSRGTVSLYDR